MVASSKVRLDVREAAFLDEADPSILIPLFPLYLLIPPILRLSASICFIFKGTKAHMT